ncbi:MAG: DUF3999 family protein, partial [Planctomycetota bacterium]|nr:DUF3999 family protein [Planctomycetota bacterium]
YPPRENGATTIPARRVRRPAALCVLGLAALLTAMILSAPARGDFDPEAWRMVREIKAPEGARGETARLALDNDVFDKSAGPDLPDLRVLCGENDDIGYVVYAPRKSASLPKYSKPIVFNRAKRGEEASEITLDLGENPPITNSIKIQTPAHNFGCAVTVEGSDDNKTWRTIRKDAAIFDFGGEIERQFTTVTIPDTRMRYLRVIVAAPPNGGPIDLVGADVIQEMPPEKSDLPLLVSRPVVNRSESQQARETWLTLDLGARRLPVQQVTVITSQENFSRAVQVEVSNDNERWQHAGGGTFFQFRTAQYNESRLTVTFPEAFGRYVRLKIANGDDPPLPISSVAVQGRPRYVYFPFEAGKQYRLFYGNPEARAPRYEYAAVFEKVNRRAAVETRLGEPRQNPRFIATRAAEPPSPWLERNQWVLYAALGVVVIALGLIALKALKKPEMAEPGPDE